MENQLLENQLENSFTELPADPESQETPRFTSEVTHNLATRKEVNDLYSLLHISYISREIMVGIMLILLFGYLCVYQQNYAYYARTFFVFLFIYWGSYLYNHIRSRKGDAAYRQMLKSTGGKPIHNHITFTEDGVCVLNTITESRNEYDYSQIQFVSQTKNFYLLFRDRHQCTVVSKDTLTGGSQQEFLAFLGEHNPDLKDKPMRIPRLGQAVKKAVMILWVLSFLFAVYQMPFVQNSLGK